MTDDSAARCQDLSLINDIVGCATEAAEAAGALALSMQQSLKAVRKKSAKDLVTEADIACEELIKQRITAAFPQHRIIAEESGSSSSDSDVTWYVDPIDGTINFSRRIPFWAVSIGVYLGDTAVAGVIYAPALDEIFVGAAARPPMCNGEPIRVSETATLGEAIISNGDFNIGSTEDDRRQLNDLGAATRRHAAEAMQRVKCLGSAAVECAYVASGRLDAYLIQRFCPWDVAAGVLLVESAGGAVSCMSGAPFKFDATSALISNGLIHDDLVQLFAGLNATAP
jgi:myo-inositol-1(or 4)-monophosphatase